MWQENFFLIYAGAEKSDILYIETTEPITWTEDIKNAKTFATLESAKMDIEKEYDIYKNIIKNTDYKSIWIIESNSDYSVIRRREQI